MVNISETIKKTATHILILRTHHIRRDILRIQADPFRFILLGISAKFGGETLQRMPARVVRRVFPHQNAQNGRQADANLGHSARRRSHL